jgi:hypothetical protein
MFNLGGAIASFAAQLPYHLTIQVFGHALFTLYW